MRVVRLAAWNEKEGKIRLDELEGLGFQVVFEPMDPGGLIRSLEEERPSAKGGMWIIWPKKSSGVVTDLRQNAVRKCGLDAGLVDYKIAAVDSTWSGLKFAVRKIV